MEKQNIQWQPIIELSIDALHQTINAIREDIKDFHGRLCAIEERNRK